MAELGTFLTSFYLFSSDLGDTCLCELRASFLMLMNTVTWCVYEKERDRKKREAFQSLVEIIHVCVVLQGLRFVYSLVSSMLSHPAESHVDRQTDRRTHR